MKSSRKIDVSKSSLISLKAELSRKQDEVNKAKAQAPYIRPVPRPKKQTIWTKKNAGVNEREQNDLDQQKEDEDILKQSRASLEAKSKLYDKLTLESSTDDKFLVNFQQKITEQEEEERISDDYDSPSDPEEDWVEYVDCLGRSRKCLKQDLDYIKKKDSELSKSLGGSEENLEEEEKEDMKPELSAVNLKREMMRQKWEQQEEMLRNKADVHYQDVLFDEARSHGVGYYGFSQDEAVRKLQQESLSKLRQQTQVVQEATKDAKERRRQQLEARLKAARRRKRERMGLPPENEESEVKEESEEKEESNQVEEPKPETNPTIGKPLKVRPWDIGKEGVKEVMSQEEWLKKKRIERPGEFAPPSSYQPDFIPALDQKVKHKPSLLFSSRKPSTQHSETSLSKIRNLGTSSGHYMPSSSTMTYISQPGEPSTSDANMRGKGTEIPPPPIFDYYGPSSKTERQKVSKAKDLENAIDAGLKFLRQQSEEKQNTHEKGLLEII